MRVYLWSGLQNPSQCNEQQVDHLMHTQWQGRVKIHLKCLYHVQRCLNNVLRTLCDATTEGLIWPLAWPLAVAKQAGPSVYLVYQGGLDTELLQRLIRCLFKLRSTVREAIRWMVSTTWCQW
jgi:hypothetical protein